jgi:hypothetical protein
VSNIILKVCILLSVYSYPSTGWSLAVVSNLFWSREYNSAKEICKYPSYSKVGGNYPLDLKIIWRSVNERLPNVTQYQILLGVTESADKNKRLTWLHIICLLPSDYIVQFGFNKVCGFWEEILTFSHWILLTKIPAMVTTSDQHNLNHKLCKSIEWTF